MRFLLEIRTDNAAFFDADNNHAPAGEIARILRDVAEQLDDGPEVRHGSCYDINGNTVGHYGERTD